MLFKDNDGDEMTIFTNTDWEMFCQKRIKKLYVKPSEIEIAPFLDGPRPKNSDDEQYNDYYDDYD